MSDLYQDNLFAKKEKKIYTVAEITEYLQALIKEDTLLSDFWISGEISNFYHHSSGHMYFTLKDKNSQLKTVMFKGYNSSLDFEPEEGMVILAEGIPATITEVTDNEVTLDFNHELAGKDLVFTIKIIEVVE